jgi:hypothetical protein
MKRILLLASELADGAAPKPTIILLGAASIVPHADVDPTCLRQRRTPIRLVLEGRVRQKQTATEHRERGK